MSIGTNQDGTVLDLPLDAVTQGFGILARRRSGKSNLAGVMEETFCERGDPWVCLDPVSAHWGIRYADNHGQPGKASGHDILIVGGKIGDVPLDEKAGAVLAQILVETDISCVIDLGAESMTASQRFVADFATELLKLNETPRHVFLEEAHVFVPQQLVYDNQKLVLGALSKMITMGGGKGIGYTLITQRSAAIAKSVLEQIDNLFVLRMSGPNDLKAVEGWFEHNVGDKAALKDIVRTLPGFQPGEAWLLSPDWMHEVTRLVVRERHTYHAGRTPKRGEKPIAPRKVELGKVIERFKAAAAKRQVAAAIPEEQPARKRSAKAVAEMSCNHEEEIRHLEHVIEGKERELTTLTEERNHAVQEGREATARARLLEQHQAGFDDLRKGLRALGIGNGDGGGEGLSEAEVHRIVAEAVRDLPSGGTVYVPAPEVLRKKYQQQAAARVFAKIGELTDEERAVLMFLLGQAERFMVIAEIAKGVTGRGDGENHKRTSSTIGVLMAKELLAKGGSKHNAYRPRLDAWTRSELSPHSPTDNEVEEVHRAVLAKIAGAG